MSNRPDDIPASLEGVREYYTAKIDAHGPTPQGVDWGSAEKQQERFRQLTQGIDGDSFSLVDVGCGYGALWDYLNQGGRNFRYLGIDISAAMIAEAQRLHDGRRDCRFEVAPAPPAGFDYVVSSGIFNVMGGASPAEWEAHVHTTMTAMFEACTRLCAFNFLTGHADAKAAGLYYPDPATMLDFCIRSLSKNATLSHHYGIWDFTIQLFKNPQSQTIG